ncbi:MAG: 50S ribosomal protein L30 [Christensenellaceae bacterium]|jgi:large subunit ribosomal protein L30|nr:50S ribosomal protein L30 [Christensenellaceae bacterium]
MAKIKVTLVRSTIGCVEAQKANIAALGLKKINSTRIHEDSNALRGKIAKVAHLVKVEEVD